MPLTEGAGVVLLSPSSTAALPSPLPFSGASFPLLPLPPELLPPKLLPPELQHPQLVPQALQLDATSTLPLPPAPTLPSLPRTMNVTAAQSLLPDDIEEEVGGGWRKRIVRRKGGKSEGQLDVYITPPAGYYFNASKGKRLRSNEELIKFLADNPTAIPYIDPAKANFHKSFDADGSFSHLRVVSAIEFIQTHIGPDGRADMTDFKPSKSAGAKKKGGIVRRKMVAPSQAKGRGQGRQTVPFDEKREIYLNRMHTRVAFPNAQQMDLMASTMGVSVADVAGWFRRKNGIDALLASESQNGTHLPSDMEGVEEADEDNGLSRPPRKFDILDCPGVCQLLIDSDEDNDIDQPPFELVWDNAEIDEEADYFLNGKTSEENPTGAETSSVAENHEQS